MDDYIFIGFTWSWWLTFGWTAGYEEGEKIFWLGPIGLLFDEDW